MCGIAGAFGAKGADRSAIEAMIATDRPPRAGRRGRVARRRGRDRPRQPAAGDHRFVARGAAADALRRRAASSSPSTAKSTIIPSFARGSRPRGQCAGGRLAGPQRHRDLPPGDRRLGPRAGARAGGGHVRLRFVGPARSARCGWCATGSARSRFITAGWARTWSSAPSSRRFARYPGFAAEIDRRASVAAFAARGYMPAPLSIYRGIFKLPPASILTVETGAEPLPRSARPRTGIRRRGGAASRYWSYRSVSERRAWRTDVGRG